MKNERGEIVGQKKFTPEEQRVLRENPYVEKVSETTITYTKDFKAIFAMEYATGKFPSVILRECGFDHKMLGKKRQNGIVRRTKTYTQRLSGFSDIRKENSGCRKTIENTDADKIEWLEHQVKYLKQENEFLKKIQFLDRQAELECKRKQNRKKNMESSRK